MKNINLSFDLTILVEKDLKDPEKIVNFLKRGIDNYINVAVRDLNSVFPELKNCEINLDIDN